MEAGKDKGEGGGGKGGGRGGRTVDNACLVGNALASPREVAAVKAQSPELGVAAARAHRPRISGGQIKCETSQNGGNHKWVALSSPISTRAHTYEHTRTHMHTYARTRQPDYAALAHTRTRNLSRIYMLHSHMHCVHTRFDQQHHTSTLFAPRPGHTHTSTLFAPRPRHTHTDAARHKRHIPRQTNKDPDRHNSTQTQTKIKTQTKMQTQTKVGSLGPAPQRQGGEVIGFLVKSPCSTYPIVRTVWTRLGPILVIAGGRPSSNLRFIRIGTRRAPVALRLCQPSREIPLWSASNVTGSGRAGQVAAGRVGPCGWFTITIVKVASRRSGGQVEGVGVVNGIGDKVDSI